jgi:hypothetical protein
MNWRSFILSNCDCCVASETNARVRGFNLSSCCGSWKRGYTINIPIFIRCKKGVGSIPRGDNLVVSSR